MKTTRAPVSYLTYALASSSILTGAFIIDKAGMPEPCNQKAYNLDLNISLKPDPKADSQSESNDNKE